jgi:predicted nuclease of predicted toxin-antitoxin system
LEELDESEWFEVSDEDWLEPGFKGRKLKLMADAQVPAYIVQEIRAAKIVIDRIPGELRTYPDTNILMYAQKKQRVILTLDRDFWDDKKYPLQKLKTGLIYVAVPPSEHERILRAFGLVYGCFAKNYPLDWWRSMKVRASVGEFEIKMRTWEGKVAGYKMRLRRNQVVAKEVSH